MITSLTSAPELPRLATVREMLRWPGPCVTIFLPPYHPGEGAGSPAALLKASVKEAARELAEHHSPKAVTENLLQPLDRLAHEPSLISGAHWSRVIFRSPSSFEIFLLTRRVQPSMRVGGTFSIRPLAPDLARSPAFYILALTQAGVSLLRCAGLHIEKAKLPAGVPDTLEAATAFDPPDHTLENRSVVRASAGAMGGVLFGTGSDRERQQTYLRDFFKMIGRALQEIEPEAPLVLAGVAEEVALYRAAGAWRNLAHGSIAGHPDLQELPAMLRQAYEILHADAVTRDAASLVAAREGAASRFSTDLAAILHAAFEGRVSHLYLDESAVRIDVYERKKYRSWGKEDLLNLAAVETIAHQGKVSELPEGSLDGNVAAADMRF